MSLRLQQPSSTSACDNGMSVPTLTNPVGILFRYVFREVVIASLIGTVLFTLVLFLQNLGPVMELLVGPGAAARDVLWLFALTIPQSFPFTIPIGVLVGILLALGRLSTDNEIVAMRSAGIPGLRIARPIAVFALVGMAACAATTIWLTPWSLREQLRIADSFRVSVAGAEVRPRVFIEDFPDRVIRVQDVLPGEGIHWRGIFMADTRAPERRGSFGGVNAAVVGTAHHARVRGVCDSAPGAKSHPGAVSDDDDLRAIV